MQVDVTADGRTALSRAEDPTVRIWDLDTGYERHEIAGYKKFNAFALASGAQTAILDHDDGIFRVWDLKTGCERHVLNGAQRPFALSADGNLALSGGADHTLRVWDLLRGELKYALQCGEGTVRAVALSGDMRTAVSLSMDIRPVGWSVKSTIQLRVRVTARDLLLLGRALFSN